MSEPQRGQPFDPDPVRKESVAIAGEGGPGAEQIDDRGGLHDTAPNPHDQEGSLQTAAQATGWMTGFMLPAVIVAIVALVIILYFALR